MPGSASVPDYGHPTYGPGGAQEYQTTEPQTFPTATNILGNTATVLSQGFEGGGADSSAVTDPAGSGGGGGRDQGPSNDDNYGGSGGSGIVLIAYPS